MALASAMCGWEHAGEQIHLAAPLRWRSAVQEGVTMKRRGLATGIPWVVLDRLHQLIPSDSNSFSEHDLEGLSILTTQQAFDGGERFVDFDDDGDGDTRFWRLREKFRPNE
jgi:hypothetical protein